MKIDLETLQNAEIIEVSENLTTSLLLMCRNKLANACFYKILFSAKLPSSRETKKGKANST